MRNNMKAAYFTALILMLIAAATLVPIVVLIAYFTTLTLALLFQAAIAIGILGLLIGVLTR
jgi:hypothetical protein